MRLKNQLEVHYKQAFDSYVNLPQALTVTTTVASCYCQSLRKIHVRIESLLIINFELIFPSHTAYYLHLWKSKIAFRDP